MLARRPDRPPGRADGSSPARPWRWPAAVAIVALVAVLWPLARSERHDSFPLSNYPMFTSDLPEVTSFARALGVDGDGVEDVLPPILAGGTVEVIHANRTLNRALREGRGDDMCSEIADRVRGDRPDVVAVRIVVERYDVVEGLRADELRPVDRTVRAECPVR